MNDPSSYELDALDRAILAALPDEGERIGKYLPKFGFVSELRKVVDPVVPAGSYGQRLSLMQDAGYVKKFNARQAASSYGWQRTEKGKREAEK